MNDTKTEPKPYWSDDNPEPMFQATDASLWYLFRTPPTKERRAEQVAKRYGQVAIVPMAKQSKRKVQTGKRFAAELPMINGYVFVGDPNWLMLQRLPVIKSVVGFGGVLLVITPTQMHNLMLRSGNALPAAATPSWRKEPSVGHTCDVTEGPLQDCRIKIEAITGKSADILFNNLKISVPLEILQVVE